MSPPLEGPPEPVNRFVSCARAARFLDVKRNPGAKTRRDAFPFPPLAPGGVPFSLESKWVPVRPSATPPPPNPPIQLQLALWILVLPCTVVAVVAVAVFVVVVGVDTLALPLSLAVSLSLLLRLLVVGCWFVVGAVAAVVGALVG